MRSHRFSIAVVLMAALCTITLAACGGGSSSSGHNSAASASAGASASTSSSCTVQGRPVAKSASAAAAVPASVRQTGVLSVATDPTDPPYEFYNSSNQLTGLEIEMAQAIGCTLGLKTQIHTLQFDSILTALPAGRFDVAMTGMSDTVQREKVMNFVDYQTEATAIVVRKGNPLNIKTIQDLCGHKVAAETASIPLQLLQLQNKHCSSKMTILELPSESQGYLAVTSGRANAYMDTYGTAVYTAKKITAGLGLEALSNRLYAAGYQSIGLGKSPSETALTKAVALAVEALMKSGVYHDIYSHWGLTRDEVRVLKTNNAAKYSHYLSLTGVS